MLCYMTPRRTYRKVLLIIALASFFKIKIYDFIQELKCSKDILYLPSCFKEGTMHIECQ